MSLFPPLVNPLSPEALRQGIAISRKVIVQQAFRPQLQETLPWLHRGDFVFDELEDNYYYLAREESLPAFVHAFSSVADASTTGMVRMDVNATDLETDRVTLFFQYFWGVKKAGFTYMQFPTGEQVFTSDRLLPATTSNVTRARAFLDPHISPFWSPTDAGQFFVRKGLSVSLEYFNNTGQAQIQKLRFTGKKFERAIVRTGTETKLTTSRTDVFPLVLEVSSEDWDAVKTISRPLFLRRIAGA